MFECVNVLCDRPAKDNGLCSVHYSRLRRWTGGRVVTLDELCQAGLNGECVDCGDTPFGGGRRCLPCFQRRVDDQRGEHTHSEPPSAFSYSCGCRCRECRAAAAEYQRDRRARQKAAA